MLSFLTALPLSVTLWTTPGVCRLGFQVCPRVPRGGRRDPQQNKTNPCASWVHEGWVEVALHGDSGWAWQMGDKVSASPHHERVEGRVQGVGEKWT